MPYNEKYFFEFATLKTADKAVKYYRVLFLKDELEEIVDPLIELTPRSEQSPLSGSPFVLHYRKAEDFVFYPFCASFADINLIYPYDPAEGTPDPQDLFSANKMNTWMVRFYEMTVNGTVETLKWQGFLLPEIQYEWQQAYYYRLTATDNLGTLKDITYSRSDKYAMPDYDTMAGVSVKDFIINLLTPVSAGLNFRFAQTLYYDGEAVTMEQMITSRYTAIDWSKSTPLDHYSILKDLLKGCILYLSNENATWTILNINEIATRSGNLVPFIEYDPDGVEVTTGNIDLNSSIGLGDTDLVFRDRNQIVTLTKPLGQIKMLTPFVAKNILRNYGFQYDDAKLFWDEAGVGTSILVAENDSLGRPLGKDYDRTYVTFDEPIDDYDDPINTTNKFYQIIDFLDTPVRSGNDTRYGVFIDFLYYNPIVGTLGDGFNYQVIAVDDSGILLVNGDRLNTAGPYLPTGTWNYDPESRVAVFTGEPVRHRSTLLSYNFTFEGGIQSLELRFLPYRNSTGASGTPYSIDTVRMSLYKGKYGNVKKFGVTAVINDEFDKPKGGIKTIEGRFFGGGGDSDDWYVLEDTIGVKIGEDPFYIASGNKWTRHWEEPVGEGLPFKHLNELFCRDILSFYSRPGRKFSGHVYGEDISYPKYFQIAGAFDKGYTETVAEEYIALSEADGALSDSEYCIRLFFERYASKISNFLMVEASFDYRNSTTAVKLEEDMSSTNERGMESGLGGSVEEPGGVLGSPGDSTVSSQQGPIGG